MNGKQTTLLVYQIIPNDHDQMPAQDLVDWIQVRGLLLYDIDPEEWIKDRQSRHTELKIWRREDFGLKTTDEMLKLRESLGFKNGSTIF